MKSIRYLGVMVLGGGAFLAATWFSSNDGLNLTLMHPLVLLAWWTAQYGGAAAFLIAATMLVLTTTAGNKNG